MRTPFRSGAVIGIAFFVSGCNVNIAGSGVLAPSMISQGLGTISSTQSLGREVGPNVRFACPDAKPGFAQCLALVRTDTFGGIVPSVGGYGPSDLQAAYDLPSSTRGFGQTIAVIDSNDNPDAESDLATYRSYFGLPPCTTSNGCFQKLNQEGYPSGYPAGNTGSGLEIDLDTETVSAACPNCHIMLVEANDGSIANLAASVDTAVAKGANVISNSYQVLGSDSYGSHYNHPGVVILAAAGDHGYEPKGAFPSDQPTVVSVGGTTLIKGGGVRGWTETVWGGKPEVGTGSGCTSSLTPKPAWQLDRKPSDCQYRTMNDVAAVGDPNTGVAEYDSYGNYGPWLVSGGTSVSTPLVAAVYGLAENASTQDAAKSLYPRTLKRDKKVDAGLYDITSGNSGTCTPAYLCTAGPEYDGPTGNGTPHGIGAF